MHKIDIALPSMHKGITPLGKDLIAWDSIQKCRPDICPLAPECDFRKTSSGSSCAVQIQYLQNVVDTITSRYKYLSEDDLFKVGMEIIPLYSMLCKMKIVEKALDSVTGLDAKGNIRIHPIYREIRETIKTIGSVWKDIGIKDPKGALSDGGFIDNNNGYGDPNHHSRLISEATDKRRVVR